MNDKEIEYSIKKNEVELSIWEKSSHYSFATFSFFISTVIIVLYLEGKTKETSKQLDSIIILGFIASVVFGFLFYRLQRNRLKYKIIETRLTRSELYNIIQKVSKELKWTKFTTDDRMVVAKTFPSLFSGSRGEQITILFDNKRVFVNSICNPEKRSPVVAIGRNKKNTNRLIDEIEKASSLQRFGASAA